MSTFLQDFQNLKIMDPIDFEQSHEEIELAKQYTKEEYEIKCAIKHLEYETSKPAAYQWIKSLNPLKQEGLIRQVSGYSDDTNDYSYVFFQLEKIYHKLNKLENENDKCVLLTDSLKLLVRYTRMWILDKPEYYVQSWYHYNKMMSIVNSKIYDTTLSPKLRSKWACIISNVDRFISAKAL